MCADHISDALVTIKTGSPITLKHCVLLDTCEVLELSSIKELFPLPVAGINVQNSDVTLLLTLWHLRPHVNTLDYP